MSVETLTTIMTAFGVLFGGGGILTIVKVFLDRKAGVKGEEAAARRDMVADRDGLIDTLFRQSAETDKRLEKTERVNEYLRAGLILFGDHIDTLESHIYRASMGRVDLLPFPARPKIPKEKEGP